jgi:hypothetical protein
MVLAFGDGAATDASLDGYAPPNPSHFGVTVQVFVGDSTIDVSDSFDILVCTPSWMAEQVDAGVWDRFRVGGLRAIPESVAVGTGIWFMRRWDAAEFDAAVRTICAAFSPGPDWGTVASRIGRLMPWEFDYRYDEHVNEHFGTPFPPAR